MHTETTNAGTEPVLQISDMSVRFKTERADVTALESLDLAIDPGRIVAIVGESGSGKSVAMRAALRLLPDTAEVRGEIRFEGRSITQMSAAELSVVRGGEIAMIFQEPSVALSPVFTIGQQIVEVIRAHRKTTRAEAREQAIEMLGLVGIPEPSERFNAYPHQLSGGQKQRVTIAMALVLRPKLIIADEPTTALDVTVQASVLDLMRECRSRFGTAIALITHNMGVVADIADEVVVMQRGRLIEHGPVDRIFARAQHEYTRQLIAAVPTIPPPEELAELAATSALAASSASRASRADGDSSAPLLEVEGLTFSYGRGRNAVPAISDVNLRLERGEMLGIVGESGSGKSTVAQCLIGLHTPSSGSVRIDGHRLTDLKRGQRQLLSSKLGVIFQDPRASIYPRRTVGEAIREPLDIHRVGNHASRDARVMELLDAVELPAAFAARFPHELSGGQRQRVAIARALALRPALVVADEPTSALDVSIQEHVLHLLHHLMEELDFGCALISHDLGVVSTMTDRVAVMRDGRVIESGQTGVVLSDPQHPYTRNLIAAVPVPDPRRQVQRREARRRLGAGAALAG